MRYARTPGSDNAGGPARGLRHGDAARRQADGEGQEAPAGAAIAARQRRLDRHRRQPRSAAGRRPAAGAARHAGRALPGHHRQPRATPTSTRCGGSTAPTSGTRPACAASPRRAGAGDRDRLRPGVSRPRSTSARPSACGAACAPTTGPRRDLGLAAARQRPARGRGRGPGDLQRRRPARCCARRSPRAACGSCGSTSPTSRPHLPARARRRPALPRHRAVASKQRDLVTDRSWHGSPDVRPRRRADACRRPASLPWRRSHLSRRHRAAAALPGRAAVAARATRACAPTASGTPYFSEVLRDLGAPCRAAAPPMPALNVVQIDTAFWNLQHDSAARHRRAVGHRHADRGRPARADARADRRRPRHARRARCQRGASKVDIVVHHRGLDAVDGADVRVTLLRWIDPKTKNAAKWNDPTTWFTRQRRRGRRR